MSSMTTSRPALYGYWRPRLANPRMRQLLTPGYVTPIESHHTSDQVVCCRTEHPRTDRPDRSPHVPSKLDVAPPALVAMISYVAG
jgi:hypothetical protein